MNQSYKQRKLRPIQPILTRTQIKDLGKMMGYKSFRESVEYFMEPVNYFKLSKIKMDEIHNYLLEKGVTTERNPNIHHTHQNSHSRLLISILFPGYPIIKASDEYYRNMRENKNQSKIISLAYDFLPTTDKYERLEELFRTKVEWKDTCTVSIPLKLMNRARVGEGHASLEFNVRLFLYMWTTERIPCHPVSLTRLAINGDWQTLSKEDRDSLDYGFHHIDLTEKSEAIAKANRRTMGEVEVSFEFDGVPLTRHVSVCAVWEKTPEEMTSQLYTQTASLYIGQAIERSSKNPQEADKVQRQVLEALRPCSAQNDKLSLEKTESLLLRCGDKFIEAWNSQDKDQPEELEVIAGDEYVSVTDPILLSIIQHPARCVFCGHASCFDALVFFKIQSTFLQWKCPVCNIKIRGIQDLYIDYQTKLALKKYPNQERFLKKNDTYTAIDQSSQQIGSKRSYEVISVEDEQAKKLKQI